MTSLTGEESRMGLVLSTLDIIKLREQSQVAFRLAIDIAEITTPPSFVPTLLPDAVTVYRINSPSC